MLKRFFSLALLILLSALSFAQLTHQPKAFSRQDTLRGTLNENRTWWDVQHYAIYVEPEFTSKSIKGKVDIQFNVVGKGNTMQIDLQEPMQLTKAYLNDKPLTYTREGNAFLLKLNKPLPIGSTAKLALAFEGNVRVAVRPPWDGGWIFTTDKQGRPWMSVACQGLGASVWYPCKDHQSDEPDKGATLKISVPDSLMAVGNGRLKSTNHHKLGYTAYEWEVKNPINNYNIIPYIGKYINFNETFKGEKGDLDCNYWVLDYNLNEAKNQFKQAPLMLKAFESVFGPYPFYEDGYKLIEAPHLGMEHQSAVAYGNGFKNGYHGRDLSSTGWGLKWDFIIVHESGHEWFGNNITTNDVADMWVHEGFTNYSETVFTTYYYGKEAGDAYVQGTRKLIRNDIPIIGPYGVNKEGSGDMYYKGGNLIHYIKQLFNNDSLFNASLREMNKTFYHKTVTTKQVEDFWSKRLGIDLSKFFDQYLRDTRIPVLEYQLAGNEFKYRWNNCVEGYTIPVAIISEGTKMSFTPTTTWQSVQLSSPISSVKIDPNFYAGIKNVSDKQ